MFDFVRARGIRGVVFSLDNLLLAPLPGVAPISSAFGEERSLLFHRAILDNRSEPLAPLFRNKPGIMARVDPLLAPFFPRSETPSISALYAGYGGSPELAEEIGRLKDEGFGVAVWDNCLAGTTRHLHEMIDKDYSGLFPRSLRFLSTGREAQLGDDALLSALWKGTELGPDDLLILTANPGQKDLAMRAGMRCFLMPPGERTFASALRVYLGEGGGPVHDPFVYMTSLARFSDWHFGLPAFHEVLSAIVRQQRIGPLESDLRCMVLDRKVWAPGGLASQAAAIEGAPLPERFKPVEQVAVDAKRLVDVYLKQIERGHPALARSAMLGLMAELKGVLSIQDDVLRDSGLIEDLLEQIISHVRENRPLYVETAQVFHGDEWSVLTEVFREDDSVLDARYASWVDQTITLMREMSARNVRLKDIRRVVKERLVDDLILRLMEMEMTHRSLNRSVPHHELFPRHHDARNRAALFTANIDDKEAWRRSAIRHTKTLEGWIRGLALQMARMAREAGGQLTFSHEMDAGFPQVDLGDLDESELRSIDDILTELVRNAIKYRRPGVPVRVTVNLSEGENHLDLKVSDNGMGIHDLKAVLQNAVREHPEMAEGYGGGLVSVRRHLDNHPGWRLTAESLEGSGSSFTLSVSPRNKEAQRQRLSDSGYPKI